MNLLLYILAGIGVLTLVVVLLVGILMFFGLMEQPVSYLARPDEVQRYLAAWGCALADGGRIVIGQPDTDRSVTFIKRQRKKIGDRLVLRFRNAGHTRRYFGQVESALSAAGIRFEVERTPAGRPCAIVRAFPLDDPLMLSAAAHAARISLSAMGSPDGGPFKLTCTGSQRSDYVPGSVEVIPWTRGYRAGFRLGQLADRIFGRS